MKYICKLGELMLKSRPVRRSFLRALSVNIRDALEPADVTVGSGYVIVETDAADARERLRRVFGIHSVASVVSRKTGTLDDVVAFGLSVFSSRVRHRRFAVRCKRVGRHSFGSLDVERVLGARLAALGKVDLTAPEIVCRIEVRDDETSCLTDVEPGAGGLPLGTQGRALALMSGGIDSPVAAWYALKRGLRLDYLFCSLGGPAQMWGPTAVSKHLADNWSYGYRPKLYIVDFIPVVNALMRLDHRYRNILLKRFFYRMADRLASTLGAGAFVTGEMLGQVSSQTLSNLDTISRVTRMLVLRPLIGMDKTDVVSKAREIGTLTISEHVPEFCNIAVRKPRTRSDPETLIRMEASLDEHLIDAALKTLHELDLKAMAPPEPPSDVGLDTVPPGVPLVWIDTGDVPVPDGVDEVVSVSDLRRWSRSVPKSRPVVLACEKGVLSQDTAHYLREIGIEAYALTSGALRKKSPGETASAT